MSRALVWAYCRVSTRNAEQESSMLEQRSRAEAFAVARTCALHVVEERASARTLTARPRLLAMLREIEATPSRDRPRFVFVTAFDRLARDMIDAASFARSLAEQKVALHVMGRGDVDLRTFADRAAFVGESMGGDAENEARSARAKAS